MISKWGIYAKIKAKRRSSLVFTLIFASNIFLIILPSAAQANDKIPNFNHDNYIFNLPNKNREVYITIDDGFTLNYKARDYILSNKLPVNNFIIAKLLLNKKYRDFYRPLMLPESSGNHTLNHRYLPAVSNNTIQNEICEGERVIGESFGVVPTFFRPPFGGVSARVLREAEKCGYHNLILWDVTANGYKMGTWGSKKLIAGDIILLHWNKQLDLTLKVLVERAKRDGVVFAYLPTSIG